MDLTPTASQTIGPYLHLGLTDARSVASLFSEGVQGERLRLTCRVLDGDNLPVPDAMIELWQADAAGHYNHPGDPQNKLADSAFRGIGRLPTGEDGACTFQTIKPGRVPSSTGELQAPHISVSVFGRGLLKRLATRIYFAGEASNESDPILALVPEHRRATLFAQPGPQGGAWHFEIRLCGEGETVFFDV